MEARTLFESIANSSYFNVSNLTLLFTETDPFQEKELTGTSRIPYELRFGLHWWNKRQCCSVRILHQQISTSISRKKQIVVDSVCLFIEIILRRFAI
jgi:hypothetical protein